MSTIIENAKLRSTTNNNLIKLSPESLPIDAQPTAQSSSLISSGKLKTIFSNIQNQLAQKAEASMIQSKADQTALDAISATIQTKADQTALDAISNNINEIQLKYETVSTITFATNTNYIVSGELTTVNYTLSENIKNSSCIFTTASKSNFSGSTFIIPATFKTNKAILFQAGKSYIIAVDNNTVLWTQIQTNA